MTGTTALTDQASTPEPVPEPDGDGDRSDAPRRATRGRPRPGLLVLANRVALVAPVGILLGAAWAHRWVSDDGFINLRVVEQILAGNGPVFNAGERVEAATSPLWVLLLALLKVVTFGLIDLPWLAVVTGIAVTVAAVVVAMVASRTLVRSGGVSALVWPAGILVLLALPPFWDFASSGLETGMLLLWLASCLLVLVRRCRPPGSDDPLPAPASPWWVPMLLSLGFLIRPDAAVYTLVWFAALFVGSRPGWRGWAKALLLGAALPVGFQVFRMGYYGVLVPNTAMAKEAGLTNWDQGFVYLHDFVDPYHLWVPLVLLGVLLLTLPLRRWIAEDRWPLLAAMAAPIIGGLLHGAYILRVGGDFMHGRLLLPAVFCLALPVMVVPLPSVRGWGAVRLPAYAGLVLWAVLAGTSWRVPYDGIGPEGVADERAYYSWASGNATPVSIADYGELNLGRQGRQLQRLVAEGRDLALYPTAQSWEVAPRPPGSGIVASVAQVGVVGYMAGPDVTIVDIKGLGDPLAARLELHQRARPGHEKELPVVWRNARYEPWAADSPGLSDVRAALGCGDLAELVAATSDPLTPGRFMQNLVGAPARTSLRFDSDPVATRRRFCG